MTEAFEAQKGKGRPKGALNKSTKVLKEAILQAAENSHDDGLVGYLQLQARENPTAFMTLIGKVLPLQHTGEDGADIKVIHTIERRIVNAQD